MTQRRASLSSLISRARRFTRWAHSLLPDQPRRTRRSQVVSRPRAPRPDDPMLKGIWDKLIDQYFPEQQQLKEYSVRWSARRQKRTLGSCNMTRRLVNIATELSYPEHHQWLEPLIYHELCHAALGTDLPRIRGKRRWHGDDFKRLEARHPGIAALNHWSRSGGWASAVRSHHAKQAHQRRNTAAAGTR